MIGTLRQMLISTNLVEHLDFAESSGPHMVRHGPVEAADRALDVFRTYLWQIAQQMQTRAREAEQLGDTEMAPSWIVAGELASMAEAIDRELRQVHD